jgi:hypothetical protein
MSGMTFIFLWWLTGFIPLAVSSGLLYSLGLLSDRITVGDLLFIAFFSIAGPVAALWSIFVLIFELYDFIESKNIFKIVLHRRKK